MSGINQLLPQPAEEDVLTTPRTHTFPEISNSVDNGWKDGCRGLSAVSQPKSSFVCLQQSSGSQMGCAGNVWTGFKTKGCEEHALSNDPPLAEQPVSLLLAMVDSCDGLQIPITDEIPNEVKVSECIAFNLHPSLRPMPCSSSFFFPYVIDPAAVPSCERTTLITSNVARVWPHQPGGKMLFKPGSDAA